eukprot:TRINITY_DN4558_c0_g1_i4.p3 TRINITY_DN4558_c0_g1~~TRINITY_DN4558_c0_g1_i4.p3  ORF type:complete len:359 (+),score=102.23 TRINITY_DN4558_c0_g1_i4:486-1562(+)
MRLLRNPAAGGAGGAAHGDPEGWADADVFGELEPGLVCDFSSRRDDIARAERSLRSGPRRQSSFGGGLRPPRHSGGSRQDRGEEGPPARRRAHQAPPPPRTAPCPSAQALPASQHREREQPPRPARECGGRRGQRAPLAEEVVELDCEAFVTDDSDCTATQASSAESGLGADTLGAEVLRMAQGRAARSRRGGGSGSGGGGGSPGAACLSDAVLPLLRRLEAAGGQGRLSALGETDRASLRDLERALRQLLPAPPPHPPTPAAGADGHSAPGGGGGGGGAAERAACLCALERARELLDEAGALQAARETQTLIAALAAPLPPDGGGGGGVVAQLAAGATRLPRGAAGARPLPARWSAR